eukprot:CAMPEP_0185260902 /NCGR_PEP_ID=MMETSP1359-20130426/9422_1 /TAXON_ID=552665 /ORGANISM="Bigelowiella longifila, Strain CCMP242" /LENGTH=91 /DNA_ID=CAMNT_0027847353 /DNA_START=1223 /DNA_END=1501 /DNA_ORIENTATION=-
MEGHLPERPRRVVTHRRGLVRVDIGGGDWDELVKMWLQVPYARPRQVPEERERTLADIAIGILEALEQQHQTLAVAHKRRDRAAQPFRDPC